MKLKDYFKSIYKANPEKAVNELSDDVFLSKIGWKRVFSEGHGEGVYNPEEGVVAIFDTDDLGEYSEYHFYKYNPKAWVLVDEVGWDGIYGGNNGEGEAVESVEL